MASHTRHSRVVLISVALSLGMVIALIWILGNSPVQGVATLTATTTGDTTSCGTPCSLRGAIAAANSGDTINIPTGTYTLALGSELTIDKSLTLSGEGADVTIIQAAASSADATSRVFNVTGGSVEVTGLTIRHGRATGDSSVGWGGEVQNSGALTLVNIEIAKNIAVQGGWVWNHRSSSLTIIRSSVTNNEASGHGGGIRNNDGTVAVVDSAVFRNRSGGSGGGMLSAAGTANVLGSTISRNIADGTGGGIYNSGTLSLTNSTISGNRGFNGGGITQTCCQSSLVVVNTIIANSNSGSCCNCSLLSGTFTSLGHNLGSDNNSCPFNATGDLSNTDPLLGPLADNGGPTFTHALLPGSPAIDAGDDIVLGPPHNLTTDQRGQPRMQGAHVDIGAYEACGLPGNLVTVGWTLIGWACDVPGHPAAIATTLGGTVRIYGYDRTVPSNPWSIYDSAAPPFVNTLTELSKWNGYWIYYAEPVVVAGDVNGDGKSDFIVGAPYADPGGRADAGSAYVYSGADGSILYQRDGGAAYDNFGLSVSTAGDVNGDGKDDFIVGAHQADPGGRDRAGSAYVYSGADGSLLYQRNGGAAYDNFGLSVSTAGDANGDGKDDFIVGAILANPGGKGDAGSAYVYSGADGALLDQRDGEAANDQFGYSVGGPK